MDLVRCESPVGPLELAPASSLRQSTAAERWDGFWGADDGYYARCTRAGGAVEWFQYADVLRTGPNDGEKSARARPLRRTRGFPALVMRAAPGAGVLLWVARRAPR